MSPDEDLDYRHTLSGLLAVLHRDGGHFQAEHGTARAVSAAIENWYKDQTMKEEAVVDAARFGAAARQLTVERNYWRNEAETRHRRGEEEGREEERKACAYYLRPRHPELADAILRGDHDS